MFVSIIPGPGFTCRSSVFQTHYPSYVENKGPIEARPSHEKVIASLESVYLKTNSTRRRTVDQTQPSNLPPLSLRHPLILGRNIIQVLIGKKLLKVLLEPLPGLRRTLHRLRFLWPTEGVESRPWARSTIALSARFDPHKGVKEGAFFCDCWTPSESRSLGVAPVAPCLLVCRVFSGSSSG